jgi:hypothetical protein
MISHREITQEDIVRAAEINDAIATEHGNDRAAAFHIAEELGVDIEGVVRIGAQHSHRRIVGKPSKSEARMAVAMAWSMGVLAGLRTVRLLSNEDVG